MIGSGLEDIRVDREAPENPLKSLVAFILLAQSNEVFNSTNFLIQLINPVFNGKKLRKVLIFHVAHVIVADDFRDADILGVQNLVEPGILIKMSVGQKIVR